MGGVLRGVLVGYRWRMLLKHLLHGNQFQSSVSKRLKPLEVVAEYFLFLSRQRGLQLLDVFTHGIKHVSGPAILLPDVAADGDAAEEVLVCQLGITLKRKLLTCQLKEGAE